MSLAERTLGEVLHSASTAVPVHPESEYPIAGIYSFGRGLIRRPTILGSETSYATLSRLRTGQLTMSKLNAWEGALAVVPKEFDGSYVSPEYPVFDIDNDYADPAYIAHLARWPGLWDRLTPRGSMVRRKRTTPTTLLTTKAPLPELAEQRRIAARLDSSMNAIAALVHAQDHAAHIRNALANSLFSHVDIQEPLGKCLTLGRDQVIVTPEQDYKIAGVFSFGKGLIRRPPIKGSETSYATLTMLHEGQLVISKLNAWEGALAVVHEEFDGYYVSPEYPVFDINSHAADPTFIASLATWPGLWDRLTPRGSMVRRKRTSPTTLLATVVPMPNLDEQRRIGSVLQRTAASARLTEARASRTKDLQSSLLNAAFSGRL